MKEMYTIMGKTGQKRRRIFIATLFLFLLFCLFGGMKSDNSLRCRRVYAEAGETATAIRLGTWGKKSDTETRVLCPGGMSFGVRLSTRGVLVVGFSRGPFGGTSPAENAGLAMGDVILSANGKAVDTAASFIAAVEASGGKNITLTVERAGQPIELILTPQKDMNGESYKAGLWVRDSTAGLGTVTVYDPASGNFAGLGHGICDSDTGVLMPLREGIVYPVSIASVRKGQAGAPGELKGFFGAAGCGALLRNTMQGVSGRLTDLHSLKGKGSLQPLPLASREEVTVGSASLFCTLSDNMVGEYQVEICKITDHEGDMKNFIIRVTDPRLLAETGGIVQGMSGSPLVQNGKIIGAVTHVMVNDPTKGYGIYIDNMVGLIP